MTLLIIEEHVDLFVKNQDRIVTVYRVRQKPELVREENQQAAMINVTKLNSPNLCFLCRSGDPVPSSCLFW